MGPPRKNRDHRQKIREQGKQQRAGEGHGRPQPSSSSSSAPALSIVKENDQQQEAITTSASLQSQPSSSSSTSSPSPSTDIDTTHNQEIQTPPRDTATTAVTAAVTIAIRYHLHGHHSDTLPMTIGDRIKALSLVSTVPTSPNDQSTAASSRTSSSSSSTYKKNKKKPLSSKLSAATRSGWGSEEEYAIFNSMVFALDTLKEGGSHIKSLLEEVEFSMQTLAEAAEKMVAEAATAAADDPDADVDQEKKDG